MFQPNSRHCTTCQTVNPETDDDGETTCCLDTVCETDADGRCDRCNPLCGLCGFEITDGYEFDARQRKIHPERRCTEALDKASPAAKKTRKPAEKKTTQTSAAPSQRAASGSHAGCEHEATKSARAACRRQRAAGK